MDRFRNLCQFFRISKSLLKLRRNLTNFHGQVQKSVQVLEDKQGEGEGAEIHDFVLLLDL
jgi:hypothetical protein